MCGRYSNKFDGRKLVTRYQTSNRDFQFQANKNLSPTQMGPVVLIEEGRRVLKSMKWGLIPFWAKDPKIGSKCFNARAETIEEKPAFRNSFKSRRCLVPADAFYEWRVEEEFRRVSREERKQTKIKDFELPTGRKYKQPYKFTVNGHEIFSFAGLWATWRGPEGKEVETFTIITTEPNELLVKYHNRMPVILTAEKEQVWINPEFTNPVLLRGLLNPFPSEMMAVEMLEKPILPNLLAN